MTENEIKRKKPKLTIAEQVDYLKQKGVKFVVMSEADAQDFLSNHTFFFKIKAYAKCFRKYIDEKHPKFGKYIDLDFSALVLLSEIDMKFREAVLWMTLEIEHSLRVTLNREISSNPNEDGYRYTDDFLKQNPEIKKKLDAILNHPQSNPYTVDMVKKYKDSFASWNLVEVLTFGDFIKMYDFYTEKLQITDKTQNLLRYVKFIRNATAHSNCMLNQLASDGHRIKPSQKLFTTYSVQARPLTKSTKRLLSIPALHDFSATVFAFEKYMKSANAFERAKTHLLSLSEYINSNKKIFEKEFCITSGLDFIQEMMKLFAEKSSK